MAENTAKEHTALTELIHQLGREGVKTFIFADSFHPSVEIREALSAPEVMQALKESGVTRLIIEGDGRLKQKARAYIEADDEGKQRILDGLTRQAVYNGLDPERQKQWAKEYLEQFEEAHHAGIDVVMPDPRYQKLEKAIKSAPSVGANTNLLAKFQGSMTDPMCVSIQSTAFIDSLSPSQLNELDNIIKKTNGVIFDSEAEKTILANPENHPDAGSRAYIYGAWHTIKADDLDENTPDSVVIAIAPKPGSELLAQALTTQNPANPLDMPDFVYYTQEGRVAEINNPQALREFAYGSPNQSSWGLSADQEEACRATVSHLKPYHDPSYNEPAGEALCIPGPGTTWEGKELPEKSCR